MRLLWATLAISGVAVGSAGCEALVRVDSVPLPARFDASTSDGAFAIDAPMDAGLATDLEDEVPDAISDDAGEDTLPDVPSGSEDAALE